VNYREKGTYVTEKRKKKPEWTWYHDSMDGKPTEKTGQVFVFGSMKNKFETR
jgi:hypothetical protein